jgi:hypothetical protein
MAVPLFHPFRVVLAAGVLLSLLGLGSAPAQPTVKTASDTVALSPSGTVEIDTYKGSVAVETWDRAAVGYRVRIEPRNGSDDVSFTTLDVTHTEQELELEADSPWRIQIPGVLTISPGGTERASFHYVVTIPTTAHLEIDDHSSAIQIAEVGGTVVIDTYAGTVEASGLAGGLELEMYDGSARVSFSALTAPLSVDTYAGPVDITLPAGAGFDLETDLRRADQLTAGAALSLPTVTEDGDYDGPVNGRGPALSIESYSSPITLRTP